MALKFLNNGYFAGKVGIGTESPLSRLEVYGGSSGVNDVDRYVRFKASNGEKRFDFYVGGTGNASIFNMYTSDGTTKNVQIASGGTSYFNGGNVGIGTTSPLGNLQIGVGGGGTAALFSGFSGVSHGSLKMFAYGNTTPTIQLSANDSGTGGGTTYFNSGNVGIGTTNPGSTLPLDAQADSKTLEINGDATDAVLSLRHNIERGGDIWSDRNAANLIIDSRYDSGNVIGGEIRFRTRTSETIGSAINAMTIKQDGNVGIGTTSPSNPLTVVGVDSIGIDDYILHNGDGNTKFGFPSNDTFKIRTSGVDRLNINSSGNVGIGMTSPTYKLDVSGSANNADIGIRINNTFDDNDPASEPNAVLFLNAASNNGYLRIHGAPANTAAKHQIDLGSTAASSFLTFSPSGAERMRITSDGNVGIGLTNPADRLDLYDSDDNVGMYFHTATSGTGAGNGLRVGQNNANAFVWNYEATPLSLATGGTARLTINATGNVGIGTTSQQVQLHVAKNSPFPNVNAVTSSNTGFVVSGNDGLMDLLSFDDNTTVATSLGMGRYSQTTGSIIDKWGLVTWYDTGNQGSNLSDRLAISYGTSKVPWSNSEKVSITREGNVGIGTTSPTAKLHVTGTGLFTGLVSGITPVNCS